MTKNTITAQNKEDGCEIDRGFLLAQALSFSAILNDIMFDRIHEEPNGKHQEDVRDGMIFLSWHIEDLLREYLQYDDFREIRS